MKNSRQVKDRIKNLSKQKGINAQLLLRNYLFERLLERIAQSDFNEHFFHTKPQPGTFAVPGCGFSTCDCLV